MEPISEEDGNQAQGFARALVINMRSYFPFCLEPRTRDYIVEYATATFLSPLHKFVLTDAEILLVKEYLASKKYSACIFTTNDSILSTENVKLNARSVPRVQSGSNNNSSNNNICYVIPGLKGLSQQLTMSLSQASSSGPSLSQSLESDIALYETKATLYNNKFSNRLLFLF